MFKVIEIINYVLKIYSKGFCKIFIIMVINKMRSEAYNLFIPRIFRKCRK